MSNKEEMEQMLHFDLSNTKNATSSIDFFGKKDMMSDSYETFISFEDEYHSEKAVMDFLDVLGFKITEVGYTYLLFIFGSVLKKKEHPYSLKGVYHECGSHFGVSPKGVEVSITNSIANASFSGNLENLNELFQREYIIGNQIGTADFISIVSRKFLLSQKFNKPLYLPATDKKKK